MNRSRFEITDIIRKFLRPYILKYHPNGYILAILFTLLDCRTSFLGGHKYRCDHCGKEHIVYNSCGNRHCPKCLGIKQAFWVEDRINQALPVKHFHIVFTVPEELNQICLLDSRLFYNNLFAVVWDTLKTFGYSHYAVESGAICVLHTWGQNLSLHPHIHCIVPAAGLSLAGYLKPIGKKGKYLYPVSMLSTVFRNKLLQRIKKQLIYLKQWPQYKQLINNQWNQPWVVNCKPAFGSPVHVIKYLGNYTKRVAITNNRLVSVDDKNVSFLYKDYKEMERIKPTTLDGVEFLRRFCLHILPKRFVKIRYYGIYSSSRKSLIDSQKYKMVIKITETTPQRFFRLSGIDISLCPFCKKGYLKPIFKLPKLPRIRSPGYMFFNPQNIL